MHMYDAHSGGEREIQRTMLELLNQLDGFDRRGDVKVILATNKIECLDPSLIRPGRIDRKIEFLLSDIKTMRRIFQVQLLEEDPFHLKSTRVHIAATMELGHSNELYLMACLEATTNGKPVVHPATVDLRGKVYKQNATTFLMDDVYRNPGPLQFEGPGADSKAVSLCVEDLDYMGRIKELNDYLDKALHYSHSFNLTFAIELMINAEDSSKGINNIGVVVTHVRLTSLSQFHDPQFVSNKLIQAEKRNVAFHESTKDVEIVSSVERPSQNGGLQVYEFEYKLDSTMGGLKTIFSAAFVASKKLYLLNIAHSDNLEQPLSNDKRVMLEQVLHSFDVIAPSSTRTTINNQT
ncbi:PsbP domain-containing protein 2, chloroplastic [Tanacetum coccineum]